MYLENNTFYKTCYLFPLPKEQKTKTSLKVGFPIRKFPDQRLLTPNRNLSQPATSFIASDCQGIHQMPFKTLEFKSRAGINPLRFTLNISFGPFEFPKERFSQFCQTLEFIIFPTRTNMMNYDIIQTFQVLPKQHKEHQK